jgi:hypothetical protein
MAESDSATRRASEFDLDQGEDGPVSDIRSMSSLIVFRCPRTGMKVQTPLFKQAANEPKLYELVTCPACTQFHFINKATGKALGDSTE